MAHKEYGVTEILDILRRAQANDSIRRIARTTGVARNTVRNYLRLAAEHGFSEEAHSDRLQEIALAVFRAVHGFDDHGDAAPGAAAPLIPIGT